MRERIISDATHAARIAPQYRDFGFQRALPSPPRLGQPNRAAEVNGRNFIGPEPGSVSVNVVYETGLSLGRSQKKFVSLLQ